MIHRIFQKDVIMKPLRITLALLASMTLGACSTVTEGSQQQITFETVGAVDAVCEVNQGVNDFQYQVRPPQTIWIKKSRRNLTVECDAPGNRKVTKIVETDLAATTFLNVFNGLVPGAAYDAESGAFFKYPDKIVIDFTTEMAKPNPLPSYHNLDTLDPDREASVENMGPDNPEMPGEKDLNASNKVAWDEYNKEQAAAAAADAERQSRIDSVEGGFYGDKGNTK